MITLNVIVTQPIHRQREHRAVKQGKKRLSLSFKKKKNFLQEKKQIVFL